MLSVGSARQAHGGRYAVSNSGELGKSTRMAKSLAMKIFGKSWPRKGASFTDRSRTQPDSCRKPRKEWFGLRCATHTPRKPTRKAISPKRLEKLLRRQSGAQTNAQAICSNAGSK